ncbi:MAG: TetR/AcrR family transcriptional regulator [Desulfobacterales bacterium]|jgi:AcrR family transcriptional regulator
MGLKERKRREKAERRKQILDAARQLLFQKGLNGTTISQIAKIAELGVGTIYFYYANKEEVFVALQEEGLKILLKKIKTAHDDSLNPETRLINMAQAYLAFSEENKNYFDVINYFLSSPEVVFASDLKEQIYQHGNNILAYIEHTIVAGTDVGLFKKVDPRRSSLTLWATMHGLIQFKKLQNTLLQNDSHQQMVEFAIHQFIENLKSQRNKLRPTYTGWEHNKL